MNGTFTYSNPTRLHFGPASLDKLGEELCHYGPSVLLTYGKQSIKKSGLYDKIVAILQAAGKQITEDPGVMPNPTVEKLAEGAQRARDCKADLILAVGGGSVCDYAKAVSVAAWCTDDPWEKYYIRMAPVDNPIIPVGCVLTMAGTGSEMNGGSVITNHAIKRKIGRVFDDRVFPRFSILNPELTLTLPRYQMVAGCFDIMSHILEQYLSGTDNNTSDYIAEGLMRSLITASRVAARNPQDYEARSNIMWTATWALNTLISKGKTTDWMVHMMGQSVGAYTDATHGMTLAAVSLPYYRFILPLGLAKFKRFAQAVWGVNAEGKSEEEIALEGLDCMRAWMQEIGLVLSLRELGATEDMLDGIAEGTFLLRGGYKPDLTTAEVRRILQQSL